MSLLSLVAKLTLDKSQYTQGLNDAQDEVNNAANGFRIGMATAAAAGVAAIGAFGVSSVKTAAEFDSAMSQVQAISGATGDDMVLLRDKAAEMGATTVFTAAQAGDAMNYMAMAGWKTEDMLGGIEGVMNLAAASGEDLATTSDIVTDALTAFGLSASDSGHFADILAAASSSANTNVSMMGETFRYVAPVAGALGFTAEDTAIAIGLMANAGVKSSQAGTALRSILTRISTDAGASEKTLGALGIVTEKLGVQFYNTDGSVRDLGPVLWECRQAWAGLSEEEQINYAKTIAGQEGMSAWLAVMNAADGDLQKVSGSVYNASDAMVKLTDGSVVPMSQAIAEGKTWTEEFNGSAEAMAATMRDNLTGDIALLTSAWDGLKIEVGEKLMPVVRTLVQALTSFIDNIDTYLPIIAGLATAFGTLAIAVNIGSIISKVSIAFKGLFALLAANPIGIAIAAVAGLAAGIITLWNNNEGFRNKVKEIWDSITGWFVEAKNKIVGAWESITGFFTDIWNKITGVFQNVKGWFSEKFNGAKDAIHTAFSNIGGWFTDRKNDIENAFSTIDSWSQDKFQKAYDGICTAWSNVKTWASDRWTDIKDAFGDVKGWFTTKFTDAKTGIQGAWSDMKTWASNKWTDISGAFGDVGTWFSTKFTDAKNGITGAFSNIGSWFSDLWTNIKGLIKLPHFSITGSLSIAPPSVPHLSVQWYKKAYDNAMLFRSPTVLGTSTGYKGFGDGNGAEVVLGLNKLKELVGSTGATYNVTVNAQPGQNAEEIAREVERVLIRWQNQERLAYA